MRTLLVGALVLAGCATTNASDSVAANDPAATRAWLADFEAQYAYDTGYMEQLLELSPAAYDAFAGAMGMAEVREHLSVDAHFVGCISALLADDCGQCTQLNLKMAVEAGVDRALLRQLMEDPVGPAEGCARCTTTRPRWCAAATPTRSWCAGCARSWATRRSVSSRADTVPAGRDRRRGCW
ncbi:MAG: hypothetical protein R3F29_13180 [Planctomycetota bacterium]